MCQYLSTPKGGNPKLHSFIASGSIIYSIMTQMKNKMYLPAPDNLAIKMSFLENERTKKKKKELFTQCYFSEGV